MYLLYIDESGDSGIVDSPTRYFTLTGLVVHELRWNEYLNRIIAFRMRVRNKFGLLLREEIYSARLINKPGDLARIKRNDRLTIIRIFTNEIASMPDLNIINIVVDKQSKASTYDVIDSAWKALIQQFLNTMSHRNFPGPANADERGMVIPDMGEVKKVTTVLRKMRRYNPVPNQANHGAGYRNLLVTNLVEIRILKTQNTHTLYKQQIWRHFFYIRVLSHRVILKRNPHITTFED